MRGMVYWRFPSLALAAFMACLGSPGLAAVSDRLATPIDGWKAIAALQRDGRDYCKATLLEARLALTAAHCVQDPQARSPDPRATLVFPEGERRSVVAAATDPTFSYQSHTTTPLGTIYTDVAIIELDAPSTVPPINLSRFDPDADGWVLVPDAQGNWERCPTKSWPGGVLFWIGCTREPGQSGMPVLRVEEGDRLNIVGVVVAQASTGGLFAHAVAPTLPALLWDTYAKRTE